MARFIFIFPFILVYFLTNVSKTTFAVNSASDSFIEKIQTEEGKDTTNFMFQDDFEDGNLNGWKQTDGWEVSAVEKISGEFSLKHSGRATDGNSSIFRVVYSDLNSSDIEWKFTLKNGKWDPSSSNKFWFYLCADTTQIESINGWAIGINITGSSDLLQLWRIRNGNADSLIVESDLDWNSATVVTIVVKHTVTGTWSLNYQKLQAPISSTFSGNDPELVEFRNIGLCFKYTSTRAGQLWIDDISVAQLFPEFFIQKLILSNAHSVRLIFSLPVNSSTLNIGNFKLADENNINIPIISLQPVAENDKAVDIGFGDVQGTELSLSVSGVEDLYGNQMKPETKSFFWTFPPESGSVLINEILFNPFPGGVDFVELVNVADYPIPISRMKLASRNDTLALKQIYAVSTENNYLKPGEFLVCTKDSSILASQYFTSNPESFCVMKTLPSFPDDAGMVVLLNDSLEVLDEFSYSSKMHSQFLADEDGVSLERISVEKPTTDRRNWASTAASVGFATPGLPNSQAQSEAEIQDEIIPEPKAFSPNGDGYNDELSIKYNFSKSGYIGNVRIFDVAGRQVRFLIKNQSLAQEGSWLWNGESDSGQKQSIGVYIVLVEIFDQMGNTKVLKKSCTLTDRFN